MADDSTMDKFDRELLLAAMKRLKMGDFSPMDTTFFMDRELADSFNEMLSSVRNRNNDFLIRLNDAVRKIGDNAHIKAMMDSLDNQSLAVRDLMEVKGDLKFSVERLEDYNYEMLALSRQIRNTCDPCMDDMAMSSKEVESLVNEIKATVEEISLGLLTIKTPLPTETYELLDHFLALMNKCTRAIEKRSTVILDVSQNINGIYGRVEAIIDDLVRAGSIIAVQSDHTGVFIDGVEGVDKTTGEMGEDCFNTGRYLQKVTRELDRTRNDMYRKNSDLPVHEKLRIFEVDHNVLLWRTYNNMMDLEVLLIKNVETVEKCKFALWCRDEAEDYIKETDAFKNAVEAHRLLHKHILGCFQAKQDADMSLSKKEFLLSREVIEEFNLSLMELHKVYDENGILDEHPEI